MMEEKNKKWAVNLILGIISVIWITPVFFAFLNIFKTRQEYNLGTFWALPQGNALSENLAYLRSGSQIFQGMFSSMIYAVVGALMAVILATLAAYAISHLQIRHRMFWFLFIYSGTIFPFQIYLIPIFKAYAKLGLYDTRLGMALFYTAICIPFCMFVLRNFFLGINREICESAHIDGATDLRVLTHIFVPMAKAPLAIVFLAQFTWSWNDLMFGLTFTKSPAIRTVMSTVSIMNRENAPTLLLACLLVSIPTVLLFSVLQKNFESGFVYTSK